MIWLAPLDYAGAKAIALSTEETLIMHGEALIRNCEDLPGADSLPTWCRALIIEREKLRLDVAWSAGNWHGYCKIDRVEAGGVQECKRRPVRLYHNLVMGD